MSSLRIPLKRCLTYHLPTLKTSPFQFVLHQLCATTTTKDPSGEKLCFDSSAEPSKIIEAPSSSPSKKIETLSSSPSKKIETLSSSPSKKIETSSSSLSSSWPKPKVIPFQVKAANSVHLIGYVGVPITAMDSPDGEFFSATFITQDSSPTAHSWRVAIKFEGDLAHVACCHIKEGDCIYVAGQLSAEPPPFNIMKGQAKFQVKVHTINFVKKHIREKNTLLDQPRGFVKDSYGDGDSVLMSWRDLLNNPKQWWDYRSKKLSGQVKPRYPDFKRKGGVLGLWLDDAPAWVFPELEKMEFDVPTDQTKLEKQQKGEESWKDLVENPNKWWDNRLDKKYAKGPDFKHKDTGEGLWLDSSPAWVLTRLPPMDTQKT